MDHGVCLYLLFLGFRRSTCVRITRKARIWKLIADDDEVYRMINVAMLARRLRSYADRLLLGQTWQWTRVGLVERGLRVANEEMRRGRRREMEEESLHGEMRLGMGFVFRSEG